MQVHVTKQLEVPCGTPARFFFSCLIRWQIVSFSVLQGLAKSIRLSRKDPPIQNTQIGKNNRTNN